MSKLCYQQCMLHYERVGLQFGWWSFLWCHVRVCVVSCWGVGNNLQEYQRCAGSCLPSQGCRATSKAASSVSPDAHQSLDMCIRCFHASCFIVCTQTSNVVCALDLQAGCPCGFVPPGRCSKWVQGIGFVGRTVSCSAGCCQPPAQCVHGNVCLLGCWALNSNGISMVGCIRGSCHEGRA